MQSSDIPSKSPKIFGESAAGTYIRTVPQTTADPAAASFDIGFPPATFTDEGAGGSPPDGRDFNGILNFLSAWSRWQASGAPVAYDGTFQTAIGGYPKGAIVASATTFGLFWISTTENNTTNPDGGGTGWRKFSLTGGLIGFRVFSGSTTYTPTDGTTSVEVTVIGAGGGGGGTRAMGGGQFGAGGGGGSGAWAASLLSSGFSGATITVGIGGAGGTAANGSTGGTSSFGSLSASGGMGGAFGVPTAGGSCQVGGWGGSPSGANRYSSGGAGGAPGIAFTNGNLLSGAGGSTPYGAGGASLPSNTNPGLPGAGPGGGGGGAVGQSGAGAQTGGNGANGLVIIREYA